MKKISTLLLLSAIFVSIEAANRIRQIEQPTPPARVLYQKANGLFQQKQYEAALATVEQALQLAPNLVAALALKARLAMTANRFDIARTCLQRAVEIEPQVVEHQFLLGFVLYVENDFAKALPTLEQAARLKPNDARTEFYLALTYEGLGHASEAIDKYERVLKLARENGAPDLSADALVAYARLLFTLGQFEKSENLIDRALGIDRDLRDAQYEKGRLRLERRDASSAIEHGKRALALPGVGVSERQIHYLLARAYTQAGQKELAEVHLAKFRALPPTLRR